MKPVRAWLVLVVLGCQPAIASYGRGDAEPMIPAGPLRPPGPPGPPHLTGRLEDRWIDFQFEGGQLEFELYRDGARVGQAVRNRFAVPVVLHWTLGGLDHPGPTPPVEGMIVLPAARSPLGPGELVALAELPEIDTAARFRRELQLHARFGEPRAQPAPYVYGLPFPHGLTFAVLQGFHGAFSHRGSNEYAVDFNCPVATPVLAARPGVVVAINASAQGSGTTPEYLDDRRANFVLIRHDDGTLGEYMHLSPSGVEASEAKTIASSGSTSRSEPASTALRASASMDVRLAARSAVGANWPKVIFTS